MLSEYIPIPLSHRLLFDLHFR